MKKVLVTGAAGFIGSHLMDALAERGDRVCGFDDYTTGRRENIAHLGDRVEFVEASLLDRDALRRACEGVELIFHQAALPSVPRSVQDPETSHRNNINGTFELLEAARLAGVRRVVYAASSSAYGNQPGFPRVETMRPQPLSPYAVQKLTGEFYLQSYAAVFGMETVAMRYFNIFGPRQVPDSPYSGVMAKWILQLQRGELPVVFGDGEQGRDFTYISNVVQANLLAGDAPAEKVSGRVFNVACGERHTLNETFRVIAGLLETGLVLQHGPERPGDVRDSLADISAAKSAFGYQPTVGFEEGLRRTVEWYQNEFAKPV
ncbi:MAG: SDR family oxidoreductase [Janthinobacterium lividum]